MEFHKPIKVSKKVEVTGSQHGQSGSSKPDEDSKNKSNGDVVSGSQNLQDAKKYPCFRCERFRPECTGAKSCTHDKKKDGTAVNTPEDVAQKFEALKKAKQQSGGKQFMGDAEIVPSDGELPSGWDVLADEDCFDGHPT